MKFEFSRHFVLHGATALSAAVLGSVLTLLITGNLQAPAVDEYGGERATVASDQFSKTSAQLSSAPHSDLIQSQIIQENSQDNNQDNNGVSDVVQSLKEASEERTQLARVLARLTTQVEALESDSINRSSLEANQGVAPEDSARSTAGGGFGQSRTGQDRIDSLLAVGVDLQSAQALQARQDQYQLARLDLYDQAEREGWTDSEQFSDRLAQLNEQRPDLRDELGDDAYDRYLFEAGNSNRVKVGSVIPGSAADTAGLQEGDMVISYASERVFSAGDLQQASRAGVRGESVSIRVNRQGQSLFLDLPRGPLGITLVREQQNPS